MKRVLFLALALVTSTWADTGLYQRMTPEERRAAGIEQLTPEQQTALDQAAARIEKEKVGHAVATAKAETRAAVQEEFKTKKLADVGLQPVETEKPGVIRAKITGNFKGWTGHTVFNLDNGQVWSQVDASEASYMPSVQDTTVEITPGIFGTWKLFLVEKGLVTRVKRVR